MFYQRIISYILKNLLGASSFCRFSPSCSEYAKESVFKYGAIKGGWLILTRLIRCQPFLNFKF